MGILKELRPDIRLFASFNIAEGSIRLGILKDAPSTIYLAAGTIAEGSIRLGILKVSMEPSVLKPLAAIAEGSIRLGILKAANGELAVSIKRRT